MSIFIHDETKDTINPVTDDSHISVHENTVRINPVGTTITFDSNSTAKRFLANLATAIADREPIYLLKAEEINGEELEEKSEKTNEFIGFKSEDDMAAEAEAERLAKEEASEEEAKELAKEQKKPSKAKSEVENDK